MEKMQTKYENYGEIFKMKSKSHAHLTTKELRRVPTKTLLASLSKFTYSSKISARDLDELLDKSLNSEEGEIAFLTAVIRELQSRFNETS